MKQQHGTLSINVKMLSHGRRTASRKKEEELGRWKEGGRKEEEQDGRRA